MYFFKPGKPGIKILFLIGILFLALPYKNFQFFEQPINSGIFVFPVIEHFAHAAFDLLQSGNTQACFLSRLTAKGHVITDCF